MDHTLYFDATHRVLLVAFGKRMTKDIYMNCYEAINRFMAANGPCSAIVDFSAVDAFELTSEFVREIADMTPAVPAWMSRLVVAPQPAIFGAARIVETLRSETTAPIKLVRTTEEAYAAFGTSASEFAAVRPT